MRAPPEAMKPTTGARARPASSSTRTIVSACAVPSEPPAKDSRPPTSRFGLETEDDVVAAEAERVADPHRRVAVQRQRLRLARDVVEVEALVGLFQIQRRRGRARAQRLQGGDRLDRS